MEQPEEQDVDMTSAADINDAEPSADVEDMKKRLKEMEDEAAALREMQAKVEKEMGSVQDRYLSPDISCLGNVVQFRYIFTLLYSSCNPANVMKYPAVAAADQANREEVDSRSVFVGNVDYACTPEEVQQHFQSCGTVNRVTIRTNKFGQPKGYAYVEFVEPEAVQEAIRLSESVLHGRQLKVTAKRTNVPGMKQFRPRRVASPYMGGYGFRGAYPPPPFFYSPYGYGKAPRFRMPMRYGPY
uniref:RRM domain-containing protein n=1 Tax=Chenopodium quinoa TaxID=63459 RepID=A0A803LGQ6_CHEQI